MTIFDDYRKCKEACAVSPSLLWEYDLSDFDWWKSRKVVVQRVLERGGLRDYYAAFRLYGGIEGFREIVKEVPSVVFGLRKEELRCYTRKLSREKLFNS